MTMLTPEQQYQADLEEFCYHLGCLNEIDPRLADKAVEAVLDDFVADFEIAEEAWYRAMGFERKTTREEDFETLSAIDELQWGYMHDVIPGVYQKNVQRAYELGVTLPVWALADAIALEAERGTE